MSDMGTAVSLLVATIELAQVKSIRNAIKANLIAAGGVEGALGTITMPKGVGLTREQPREVEYEPRRVVHPSPIYTARPIVRRDPIVEPAPVVPPADTAAESHLNNPLVPPWRMPMPVESSRPVVIVKCPPPPPDVINKGSLIDFFI